MLDTYHCVNVGSPKGRESYGDGGLVVVTGSHEPVMGDGKAVHRAKQTRLWEED